MVLTILSAGCSSAESTLEIRVHASVTDEEGVAGIRISLDGVEYDASDFRPDANGILEIRARVPNAGELQIAVELLQESAVVAAGSFNLSMSRDYEWGMSLFRQVANPMDQCFGCSGARGFPIAPSAQNEPGEAIWLVWGGAPRGSDIVH